MVVGAVGWMVGAHALVDPPARPPDVLPRDKDGADGRAGGLEWVKFHTFDEVHYAGITGVALSPDGRSLFVAMQGPLSVPDPATGRASRSVRILRLDASTGRPTGEFVYRTERWCALEPATPCGAEGITALVATHDEALMDLADDVLRLEDGHIVS